MGRGDPEPHRGPEVEHVEGEALEFEPVDERRDDLGEVIEGVGELVRGRAGAL